MHQLKEALIEELAQITALCLQSKVLWGYDDTIMQCCRQELTFRLAADMGNLLICDLRGGKRDSQLLGVAQLQAEEDETFLTRLFVSPARQKAGIGKSIFGWSIKAALHDDATRLLMDADLLAASFYQRMGARQEGSIDLCVGVQFLTLMGERGERKNISTAYR